MLVRLRIATFNCENLFARYKFKSNTNPEKAVRDGWTVDKTKFHEFKKEERKITAKVIKATKADVIALQEVENMAVLKKFRTKFLQSRKIYPYVLLIDGNDPRKIDVAVLSKYPLKNINTHINEYNAKNTPIFSRDCLECDVMLSSRKKIRLYVNHFKSMMDPKSKCKGRETTRKRRMAQAIQVKRIVQKTGRRRHFAILGDFNDYREHDTQGRSAIRTLTDWNKVVDVASYLDKDDRWTHYWKGKKSCDIGEKYTQLDYILISKSLARKNKKINPEIIRIGMSTTAEKYKGYRLPEINKKTKASDHAPIVVELNV